jgi:hypothetical protein
VIEGWMRGQPMTRFAERHAARRTDRGFGAGSVTGLSRLRERRGGLTARRGWAGAGGGTK